MSRKDLHIGQVLYRETKEGIVEEIVVTIGKKYFTTDGSPRADKILIDDLTHHVKNYTQWNYTLYLTKEEILAKNERYELYEKIRKYFNSYSPLKEHTLTQLRQVNDIIDDSTLTSRGQD